MEVQNNETNCPEPNIDHDYNKESIELEGTSIPHASLNSIKRIMDILKAALPFVDVQSMRTVQIMVKATELMDTINGRAFELSTLNLNEGKGDMEGMLNNIREFCTDRERQIVDMILNVIRAKNLYDTYQMIASLNLNNDSNNTDDNPFASVFGFGDNMDMMEILSSMLTPEQQSTFETLNMILNAAPDSTT